MHQDFTAFLHAFRTPLLCWLFICGSFSLHAQQNLKISGNVSDEDNKTALNGVSVLIRGAQKGTLTDPRGNFTINAPKNSTLVFSSLGYIDKEIQVTGEEPISLTLVSRTRQLTDVVVIGYGVRKKRDIIGSVSSISPADIEKSTSISPELAMQGQMPGVSVTSAGGDPSARPIVRIRGVSTFNSPDPLYVIDGVPIAEGGSGTTVDAVNDKTRRTPINIYTIVSPNDIESISVLKDASAAAVYGVRGANGVILITTKSGKKGRLRVDVDAYVGSEKVPRTYSVLNTQQYTKFYTAVYNANPDSASGAAVPISKAPNWGPVWDPTSPQYLGNSPTYDWQHAIINKGATIKNYNVRASGATDNTAYNISAGYAYNDGPFYGVNTERYSVATNLSTHFGKFIETGINLRLIQEKLDESFSGNLGAYQAAPWQAIYDKTNPYGYAPLYKLTAPISPGSTVYLPRPGGLDTMVVTAPVFNYANLWGPQYVADDNFLGELQTHSNIYHNQSAIGSGFIQVQPLPGLKIRATLSGQQYTISNTSYTSFDNWQWGQTPSNPYNNVPNATAGTTPNAVGTSTGTTTNLIKALNANYNHSWGKHNLDILADASDQDYIWSNTSVSSFVYSSDPSLRYFNSTGMETGSYLLNAHYVLIGYLGRISYNYDNKYYVEGLVRRDGSSRFAPGHQWGTFPSAAAGWRISSEPFMKSIPFINDLKIRGSYGLLGNEQTTGGWQYLSVADVNPPSYNLGTGTQNNNIGISYGNFANASLTWEKLRSANVGFDATLLNSSVGITMDYYHKVTKGIIQSVSLTPSVGFLLPADLNIADVLNRGFEFQASYNKTVGKVSFSVSGNFTTVHNEVLSLANHQDNKPGGLEEGKPIGFIYGYKVAGTFQNQAEITKYDQGVTDKISTQQRPGDLYFRNLYGQQLPGGKANPKLDSVIDVNDQTYLGKTIPSYYYGFTLSANYMGFDASIFFQGVGDVQKFNSTRAAAEAMNGYGRNQFTSVLNAWTPTNTNTKLPRAVYGDPNGNLRMSDRFVENASYLRLQNLTIGYSVPKKWLVPTKAFQGLRLYVTGINLWTATKYTGLDPENDLNPSTRQFIAGIRASF